MNFGVELVRRLYSLGELAEEVHTNETNYRPNMSQILLLLRLSDSVVLNQHYQFDEMSRGSPDARAPPRGGFGAHGRGPPRRRRASLLSERLSNAGSRDSVQISTSRAAPGNAEMVQLKTSEMFRRRTFGMVRRSPRGCSRRTGAPSGPPTAGATCSRCSRPVGESFSAPP